MNRFTEIERAFSEARDKTRAKRQVQECIDKINMANKNEMLENTVIDVTKRLDQIAATRKQSPERRGGRRLKSKEACDYLQLCRSSLVALVQGGHLLPDNPEAPNGSRHYFNRATLSNFLELNTSGEIRQMIANYRGRPRF